jgi:hypothetical protein
MNELLFMRNVVVECPPAVEGVALTTSSSLTRESCRISLLVILDFLLGVIEHLFAAFNSTTADAKVFWCRNRAQSRRSRSSRLLQGAYSLHESLRHGVAAEGSSRYGVIPSPSR